MRHGRWRSLRPPQGRYRPSSHELRFRCVTTRKGSDEMKTRALTICVIAGVVAVLGQLAAADMVVKISDTTGGLKLAWTGSIDTSALTSIGPFNNAGGIMTSGPVIFSYSTGGDGEWFQSAGLSGPPIGTVTYQVLPNTLSGDFFAMHVNSFVMPTDYVSGDYIAGSVEFMGASIGSLGITPGPHVHTISNSPSTITFSVIPEPATVTLLTLGGLAMLRRRRNR